MITDVNRWLSRGTGYSCYSFLSTFVHSCFVVGNDQSGALLYILLAGCLIPITEALMQ